MQFRRQGRRVQVLAYRGYDRERRRAIVRMVGSYDAYTYEMSDGLLDKLTDSEKEELTAYIDKMRQSDQMSSLRAKTMYLSRDITEVAEAVKSGDISVSDSAANSMYAAIDALARALRKAGYKRPRKTAAQDDQSLSLDLSVA